MIGFKVVERVLNKLLFSPFAPIPFRETYEPDKPTVAMFGSLTAFRNLFYAKDFLNRITEAGICGIHEIWRCEVAPAEETLYYLPTPYLMGIYPEKIKEYWKADREEREFIIPEKYSIQVPIGTIFCKEITILRCMKRCAID